MKKNVMTYIILAICLLLFCGVFVAGTRKKQAQNGSNPGGDETGNAVGSIAQEDVDKEKYFLGYPVFQALLEKDAEYPFQHVERDGSTPDGTYLDMVVRFKNVEVTKEKGNFDAVAVGPYKIDENGTILNDYSYVVTTIEIENCNEIPIAEYLNLIQLSFGTGEERVYSNVVFYNAQKERTAKDYFCVTMEPETTSEYTLVYLMDDKVLEEKWGNEEVYLQVNLTGNQAERLPVVEAKKTDENTEP